LATLATPLIIPTTEYPAQHINVQLGGQSCAIDIFTKSINVPILPPGMIPTDPDPVYENSNPVFLNLYVDDEPIVLGAVCRDKSLLIMNTYLGFIGDLSVVDTVGNEDPQGAPIRLPPRDLRNYWQRQLPISLEGRLPASGIGNTIPGLGSRWLLTYWPNLK